MTATHTNQTTEILTSALPVNTKIQALRAVRKDLRAGIKSLWESGAADPGHRYHAVFAGMEAELESLDAALVDLYAEMTANNA